MVTRACSRTPKSGSRPTRKSCSGATSPTWTSLSLPWSTCRKSSREPSSPATPARPRACAGSSSTSSSASSTSRAMLPSTPPSGWRGPSSSTRKSSSNTATIRWLNSGVSTSPASRRPTCFPRCSSGAVSWPISSSRRATSRTTTGSRTGSTATSVRPRSSTRHTGPGSSARWIASSTRTARCCPRCRPGSRSAFHNRPATVTSCTARPRGRSHSMRCAASCRQRPSRTSGSTGPARRTSNCCCACARTRCPKRGTTPT